MIVSIEAQCKDYRNSYNTNQENKSCVDFKDMPKEYQTYLNVYEEVSKNGYLLKYVRKDLLSLDICMAAVKDEANAILDCPVQTPYLCYAALKSNPCSIRFIKRPTEEMYNYVMEKDFYRVIKYIPEQLVKCYMKNNCDLFK